VVDLFLAMHKYLTISRIGLHLGHIFKRPISDELTKYLGITKKTEQRLLLFDWSIYLAFSHVNGRLKMNETLPHTI